MGRTGPKCVRFLGTKIDNLSYTEIHEKIDKNLAGKGYISLNDVDNIIKAEDDKNLFEAINNSLVSIADGTPLAWYGKLLGCKNIERISGPELMTRLLEERNGYKHYLMGDTEKTIKRVMEKVKRKNVEVKINGHSPPFKDEFDADDNRIMLDKINKENPDIIWVSFGGGKQEKWMHKNIYRLNRGIMIGVGAAFRFYIGELTTPPTLLQKLGLQWFFRMLNNPKRWVKGPMEHRIKFIIHFPREVMKDRKKWRMYD